MSKDRDIQILRYKIDELDKKIRNQRKHGICENKIKALEFKRLQYVDKLAELEY